MLTFREAMELMNDGKKVKYVSWSKRAYVQNGYVFIDKKLVDNYSPTVNERCGNWKLKGDDDNE